MCRVVPYAADNEFCPCRAHVLLLQVRAKLQAFRGGELAEAPFRIVKTTGGAPGGFCCTAALHRRQQHLNRMSCVIHASTAMPLP
jgi:hypothetical protein